jgi:hypothetical protein
MIILFFDAGRHVGFHFEVDARECVGRDEPVVFERRGVA